MLRRLVFLALVAACLWFAARVGDRHSWQLDLSSAQIHTLSEAAQRALDALPDGLRITAFVPDLVVDRARIEQLLAPYLAHPRVRLSFVDPLQDPETAQAQGVQRHGELHLLSGQRREVVVSPSRGELDRALNRLALQGERWIVSFTGQGESRIDGAPGGLGDFVRHLEEQGYRVVELDPRQLDALPDNTALLLIAGPQGEYGPHTERLIEQFVDSGGGLLWLFGDAESALVERLFGVTALPGIVVDAAAAQYRLERPDYAVVSRFPTQLPGLGDGYAALSQAHALAWQTREDWQERMRLQSSARSWNETGSLRGEIARQPDLGEQAGPLTVGIALEHAATSPAARVMFVGGRQFLGNGQIGQGANLALGQGLVRWLTANQGLAAAPPVHDLGVRWSPQTAAAFAVGLMAGLPLCYLGLGFWLRHRRRRA